MFALVVASSAGAGPVRATATTGAPASANARAIPRPRPRLAPATTVVLPGKSLIIALLLCASMVSLGIGDAGVRDHRATTGPGGPAHAAVRPVAQPSARVTGCRTRRGGATTGRSRCGPVARGRATG